MAADLEFDHIWNDCGTAIPLWWESLYAVVVGFLQDIAKVSPIDSTYKMAHTELARIQTAQKLMAVCDLVDEVSQSSATSKPSIGLRCTSSLAALESCAVP